MAAVSGSLLAVDASTAEVWSTVATVGATVVALALAVVPPVWRAHKRRRSLPRLSLECETGDPFVRGAWAGAQWQYLRARITNSGGGPATNVRCVVVRARYGDGPNLSDLVIDPYELHWVSLPGPPGLVGIGTIGGSASLTPVDGVRSSRVDLTMSDFELVDVCRHSGEKLELVPHDDRSRGFSYECPDRTAAHELTIRLTANEIDPIEYRLLFRFVLGTGREMGHYEDVSVERVAG